MVFSVPPRKSTAFFFEHLVRDLQVCSAVYVLSWKTAVIQKDKGVALILYILPRGSITFLRRMAVVSGPWPLQRLRNERENRAES